MAQTKIPSSFTLNTETLNELRDVAARRGVSASSLVQAAVARFLTEEPDGPGDDSDFFLQGSVEVPCARWNASPIC